MKMCHKERIEHLVWNIIRRGEEKLAQSLNQRHHHVSIHYLVLRLHAFDGAKRVEWNDLFFEGVVQMQPLER